VTFLAEQLVEVLCDLGEHLPPPLWTNQTADVVQKLGKKLTDNGQYLDALFHPPENGEQPLDGPHVEVVPKRMDNRLQYELLSEFVFTELNVS
jgi:hypothetical protein